MTNQISRDGPTTMQKVVTVVTTVAIVAAAAGVVWLALWALGIV